MKEVFKVLSRRLKALRKKNNRLLIRGDKVSSELNEMTVAFNQVQKDYIDLANAINALHKVTPIDLKEARKKVGFGISDSCIIVLRDLLFCGVEDLC